MKRIEQIRTNTQKEAQVIFDQFQQAMSKLMNEQIQAELATGRTNVILYQLYLHDAFNCDEGLQEALTVLEEAYDISQVETLTIYHAQF
ncbi:hypothetical protein [Actinobacillus delphinicola]|uniref:Uncharacterized protein n=1 Tax=Actinobacillus delphinicola TaxID=51161 RepID=A0A448TTZ5_9PAST|nr:hypothetical protein [Actinobacillus delphinicola]VEJ09375.1 Uncharacterised protein [Actinobacillus delphinicola]